MSKLVVKIYETELSVYLNNNNKQTLIQTGKENLVDIVYKIAIELGLYDNNNIQQIKLSDLWQIARESDDYLTDPYIAVNGDTSEFEIYDTIKPHLQKLLADRNHKKLLERLTKYNNIELIKIIDLMRKQDIFATILEIIYSIIIVKVLMIASDLGINEIVLDEKIENIRIRDRFSMELKKLGYTITII